jgi:hypothetical protein
MDSFPKGKGVNTMMDMSGVVDAALTFGGVVGVLMTAICTLSSQSTTVSTSSGEPTSKTVALDQEMALADAA